MDLSEFKNTYDYLSDLKTVDSGFKDTKFDTLIGAFLKRYKGIRVRDFIDTDLTYGVVVSNYDKFSLKDSLNLYLDLEDILKVTTYMDISFTGLVEVDGYTGFYVVLS